MLIAALFLLLRTVFAKAEVVDVEQEIILLEYAIPDDKCGYFPAILDPGKETVMAALENLAKSYNRNATTIAVNVKEKNGRSTKIHLNILNKNTKDTLRALTAESKVVFKEDVYVSRLGGGDPLTVFTFKDDSGNYYALAIDTFIGKNMDTLKMLSRLSVRGAGKRTYVVPDRKGNSTVHLDFNNPLIVDLMRNLAERCATQSLVVFALTNERNETEVMVIDVSNDKVKASLKELTANVDVNSPIVVVNIPSYTVLLNLKKPETLAKLRKLSRETPLDLKPILIPQIEGKPIAVIVDGAQGKTSTLAFDMNNADVVNQIRIIPKSKEETEEVRGNFYVPDEIDGKEVPIYLPSKSMEVFRNLTKLCPPIENPYTTYATTTLTFPIEVGGNMSLVKLNTTDKRVEVALSTYSSFVTAKSGTRYFINAEDGSTTPLQIDLNDEQVRSGLMELGTIAPLRKIETNHAVFTLHDGGRNVPIVLNLKKHRVIASLKRLSRFVDHQPLIVLQLLDRRHNNIDVKINTRSPRTLATLKKLSEESGSADPIQIPKPGEPKPILILSTLDGRIERFVLDLNNPEIFAALQTISNEHKNKNNARVVYSQSNDAQITISLDLNDGDTIAKLREMSDQSQEIRAPYHTYITPIATVPMKDLYEEDVLVALDINDANVNTILGKLDSKNGTSAHVVYLSSYDGSAIPIALNTTDVIVRKLLLDIGSVAPIKSDSPVAIFTVRDDRGRITPIILDLHDRHVDYMLRKLSKHVDERKPIIAMHLKSRCGHKFMIKLNPGDSDTIKILVDLTRRAPINKQPIEIPQCNKNPIVAVTTADEQGKTVVLLLDTSNAIVLETLDDITIANEDNRNARSIYIQTEQGNEEFRVDLSDQGMLNELRRLSTLSPEIKIPFLFPTTSFLSLAIKDAYGSNVIATINIDDEEVINTLKDFESYVSDVDALIDTYVVNNDKASCVKLDPTNTYVRESLLNLGDVTTHEKNFAVFALPITDDSNPKFPIPIILDLRHEEIRAALKDLSAAFDANARMTTLQMKGDNYDWLRIKLDVEDPSTNAKLLELSQKTVCIDPIVFPHPTKANSLMAFTLRENERTDCLILDTSDEGVMDALMEITHVNQYNRDAKTVYVRVDAKTVTIRVDFTDEKTVAKLRNLPKNDLEIFNPFTTSASSQIFVPMKDEYGGNAVVTLNVADVMDALRSTSNGGKSRDMYYVRDDKGAASVAVIDVDDENTKRLLLEMGRIAPAMEENVLVFTMDDDGDTVPIVLDVGNASVLSTLKTLSNDAQTNHSTTAYVTNERGFDVKLTLGRDERTRRNLQELTQVTSVKMVMIPQPNRRPMLALKLHSGHFVCLDTNDDKIDAVLRNITAANDKNARAKTVYIHDGACYPIRIDFDDESALKTLRYLATQCPTINPYVAPNARFVAIPIVDENGDDVVITIDSTYSDVVEAMDELSFRSANTSSVFYVRDDDEIKAIYIDVADVTIKQILVTLGAVESVQRDDGRWVCMSLIDDKGTVPVVLNVYNPTVVHMLQSLSLTVDYKQNVTMITTGVFKDIAIALNLDVSRTVAILKSLSQSSSTNLSPTQITNVDGKTPLMAFTLQRNGVTIPIILDCSNRNVLAALQELSTTDEKAPIIYFPINKGKTRPLRLDLTNENILNALQKLTKQAPALLCPYVISSNKDKHRLLYVNIFEDNLVKTIPIQPSASNINILKSVSATDVKATTNFYINTDEKLLVIKIDPNNSTVVQILKWLGKKVVLSRGSPFAIRPPNGNFDLITLIVPDINGQKTPITLDPNNRIVLDMMLALSEPTNPNCAVIKLNSSLSMHLNLWNMNVVGMLKHMQILSPLHAEVVRVQPAGMMTPLVAFQIMESDGGKIPVTLDFNDKGFMMELQQLEQIAQRSQATVFRSGDIKVALDLTDSYTISALRMMTKSSPIKVIPFKGSKPFVKMNVPGRGGDTAALVINTNNPPLLRYLTDVSRDSKPYSSKAFFEFEDADGFMIPLGLELHDTAIVEELRDVLKTPLTTFVNFIPPLGFKELGVFPVTIGNQMYPVTLDLNKEIVMAALSKISFEDPKALSIITIEDKSSQQVYYIDLFNSSTAEALVKISAQSEVQLLPIKIIPAYGTSALITFMLRNMDGVINLDPNDLDVMHTLKNMSSVWFSTATIIEIQDSEGRMSAIKLDFTDSRVIDTLMELTAKNEIEITLNAQGGPIVQVHIHGNKTMKFDLGDPKVIPALKVAANKIGEEHPAILLEIQESDLSMTSIKIDTIDPNFLKAYELLSHDSDKHENQILYIPIVDYYGRFVEIPLDMNDGTLLEDMKRLSHSNGKSFRVAQTGKHATTVNLDLDNSTTVEKLRQLGRKHLIQLFPVSVTPPGGQWPLIAMTIPVSTGGTASVTLDPNIEKVMTKLKELSGANTDKTTALHVRDNAGNVVTLYLDLSDPQTSVKLKHLSSLSYIQIATIKITSLQGTNPLLGMQLMDNEGGSIPFMVDTNNQNAVTKLNRLSSWPAPPALMTIIKIGDSGKQSVKLDLTYPHTRYTLRKLTKASPVNIVPIKGQKPFIVLKVNDNKNVLSTLTIDSNDQETIAEMAELIYTNDKSPETVFEFEDDDGFPTFVSLQLQNPYVVEKLKEMSLQHAIESIDVTTSGGRNPLLTFAVTTKGVTKPITLDVNDDAILTKLRQLETINGTTIFSIGNEIGNERLRLDLNDHRVVEYLEQASRTVPIGLYPIKIIPVYGRVPFLTFHLRNRDNAINLDLNDINVYERLKQLHDSSHLSTVFEIRDDEGAVSVLKLNLEDDDTVNDLVKMSQKTAIKLTPVDGKMPMLSLLLPGKDDPLTLNLGHENVIKELKRVTDTMADDALGVVVQIKANDKRAQTFVINVNNENVLKRVKSLAKVSDAPLAHTRLLVPITDEFENDVSIPLAVDNPDVVKSLQELPVTHLSPNVINVEKSDGSLLPIKLDLENDYVVTTLRALGRRHLMLINPTKMTPPNGHLYLISMIVPDSSGGFTFVSLDPNDGHVMDEMKKISSDQNAWTTTLNVQGVGGENIPLHFNLTDPTTSVTFKKMSRWSKIRLIPLKIIPAGALTPLLAVQILDDASNVFSLTLDLNDHVAVAKLMSLYDDGANATILDIDTFDHSTRLKFDLSKSTALRRLREMTQPATIKIIPLLYDDLFVAIKLDGNANVLIDAKNDEIIKELSALSREYKSESLKTTFEFHDKDGFPITIALPLRNSKVARRLIELPQPNKLATVHYKQPGRTAPLIPIPLPIKGELTPATLDPNDPSLLEMLKILSSREVYATPIDVYLETGRKTFELDLYNTYVVNVLEKFSTNRMLTLQPIKIIPANGKVPVIVFKIRDDPWITLDLNVRRVSRTLTRLSSNADGTKATTIEVQDVDGWVKVIKLNLDDSQTVQNLHKLTELSKIRVIGEPGRMPKVFFDVKLNTTEVFSVDLGNPSTTKALAEISSIVGKKPAITIEILDGSKNVFKLDFTNPIILQRCRQLNNPIEFIVTSGHVWVLDKYNRTVIIPVDLRDKESLPALQNLSVFLTPTLRGNKPIRSDGANAKAVAVLRTLGRRYLFREFSLKIRPFNRTRYLLSITIPKVYGGTHSITLDPNDDVTMKILLQLSNSTDGLGTKITVRGTESNVDLYMDLTDAYTLNVITSLRWRSMLQVGQLKVTPGGKLMPLLGLQFGTPDGVMPVVLDLNEQSVLDELRKLDTNTPTIIIESVEPAINLDLFDLHTIVVLKRLTEGCDVRLSPIKEGTPFIIMRMFGVTLTINTNQNDVVGRLNDLSHVRDDGFPLWRFEFEDIDGFVTPVALQLCNPRVWDKMLEWYTASIIAYVSITPETNSMPLFSMPISDGEGTVPVTLNMDDESVLKALEEISNDNLHGTSVKLNDVEQRTLAFNLDLENRRVINVLTELSARTALKLYPITIVPLFGTVPLIMFEYDNQLINLDMNDLNVVDRLNDVTLTGDKPATHVRIQDNHGVARTLELDLNDNRTMEILSSLSNTGSIKATPVAGKLPLLQITTQDGPIDLDLGDPAVLELLEEVSDNFPTNAMAIEIISKRCYLIDIADGNIVKHLRMQSKLVSNETLVVWITDDKKRRVRIRLNIRDPDVVQKLQALSLPGAAKATEFYVHQDGSPMKLRLNLKNAYIIRILRDLNRKHMLKVTPVRVTPANGTHPLIAIVIPDEQWGTTRVTMDPNDKHVAATLNELSSAGDLTRTVLRGHDHDYYLNLGDTDTLRVLKSLSNTSLIDVNPLEIVPAGGTYRIFAFSLQTAEYETTPFTIDVNNENVVNELQNIRRFGTNPTFTFDVLIRGHRLPVGINASNYQVGVVLKRITQMSPINVIPADDKTYVRVRLEDKTAVIDANDQLFIQNLCKLAKYDDKSPKTLFVFEDMDGFDIPIKLQLNNPLVAQKLIQLSKELDITSVQVYPPGQRAPLIALPVILDGNVHTITLNTNQRSVVDTMETLSIPGRNVTKVPINDRYNNKKTVLLNLGNPYIAQPLVKLNNYDVQLYPVKVIPAQAKSPIITIRPNGHPTLNLDVNDPYVNHELQRLSDSTVGIYTTVKVRDIDGQTTTFKFDTNNATTMSTLSKLSEKSKIKLIDVDGKMPLLNLTIIQNHQLATLTLDLGDQNVLVTLREITNLIGDSPTAISIFIKMTNGEKQSFKLDTSNSHGVRYGTILANLKILTAPEKNTLWVPINSRTLKIHVPLDLADDSLVETLDALSTMDARATTFQVKINNTYKTINLLLEDFQTTTSIRELGRRHLLKTFPIRILPPNGNLYLLPIVISNPYGGTLSLTLDPNNKQVLDTLTNLVNLNSDKTTVLHILGTHGEDTAIPLDLTDLKTVDTLKTLSDKNSMQITPMRIYPDDERLPLLGVEIKDPYTSRSFTLDLNDEFVITELKKLAASNATTIELSNGEHITMNLNDETTRAVLRRLTLNNEIRIIPMLNKKPIVELSLGETFKIDTNDGGVIHDLNEISQEIEDKSARTLFEFECDDGFPIYVYLQLGNPMLATKLKKLKVVAVASVNFIPRGGSLPITSFWVLTDGGARYVSIDLNKRIVDDTLEFLPYDESLPVLFTTRSGESYNLDVTNRYVGESLFVLSQNSSIKVLPLNIKRGESPMILFKMTRNGESVMINLDLSQPHVFNSLREMSPLSDDNLATTIVARDSEGNVVIFKLVLEDPVTFDAIMNLSRSSEITVVQKDWTVPIVYVNSSNANVTFNLSDQNVVEALKKLGDRIGDEAVTVIEIETIDGWKRLKIDYENQDLLREYRLIAGLDHFIAVGTFVAATIDKFNRTAEISLDLKDPEVFAMLMSLSVDNSLAPEFHIQPTRFDPITSLKLNLSDFKTVNSLRKFGRKYMLRVAHVKAKPVGGDRYFISMAVPEVNRGAMSITLDPNNERVLSALRSLISNDSKTTIEVAQSGHVEVLRIDFTNPQTSFILKPLSTMSSMQVETLTVIPAGESKPLVGLQITDNSGETTSVTLDLNEKYVVDELESINRHASGKFGVVLEMEIDGKSVSVSLDANNALVKEALKEITMKSHVKIKPMLGKKSVVVVDLVKMDGREATVIIDTNDQDVITEVFQIAQEFGDYPPTYIEFEDEDGFVVPVRLQLQNPNVIRRLCALKPIALAAVDVIPPGKVLPLVVFSVSINNATTPVTLDSNELQTIEALDIVSAYGAPTKLEMPGIATRHVFWFDFNNPYIADYLVKLSQKPRIRLYPLEIIPANGSAPLITFEFQRDNQPIVINLDINDDYVLRALQTIPHHDDNDVVKIAVEDKNGQIYSFKLNIDEPSVIELLLELTRRNAIGIIPNPDRLPLLTLAKKDIEGNSHDIALDLSNNDILNQIDSFAATINDDTPVTTVAIRQTDGRRRLLKFDLSAKIRDVNMVYDGYIREMDQIRDVLHVPLTIGTNRVINVSLDITDRKIVEMLGHLRPAWDAPGSVYEIITPDGTLLNIKLDTHDRNTQNVLRRLGRMHFIRVFPVSVTPPDGNRRLISIVVPDPYEGTISLALDPNIPIVAVGLEDLAAYSAKQSDDTSNTVVHNIADDGTDAPISIHLSQQHVISRLKQLHRYSKLKVCNVRITSGNSPLLGIQVIDGVTSDIYTIDMDHPTIRSSFERQHEQSPVARIEYENVFLKIDFADPATKTLLKNHTRTRKVKFVSCAPRNTIITINDVLRIDTNNEMLIEKLYDVPMVSDDGSPKTTFEFEDVDGFTAPVTLQLQNPHVDAQLSKLKSPRLVASITVTPFDKLVPLTTLSIPTRDGFAFITVDTNAQSTTTILNKLSVGNPTATKIQREDEDGRMELYVDVNNPYVAETLSTLSKKCSVQLYPVTIIPSPGHLPLIAFRFENKSFSLDLNDDEVLRSLRQLTMEASNENLPIEINVRANDGRTVRVMLELNQQETLDVLIRLSSGSRMKVIPSLHHAPILEIKDVVIDLSRPAVLAKLEKLTQSTGDDTITIQILEGDGTIKIFNFDLSRYINVAD